MKRNRVNSLLQVALMALLVLSACSDKRGVEVIPSAKLEAVLYDYHLAQVIVNDLPSNQRYKKDLYFDYVYEKHGVTKAEVDSSLVYYARYPEGLSEIYGSLSKRIEADLNRLENEDKPIKKREAVSVVGDSADLWYDARIVQLSSSPLGNNRFGFTIPTDTNFKAGDHIAWSGRIVFLQDGVDSLNRFVHLDLSVKFMNDSISSADTLLYTSGDFSISVTDSSLVKSIKGTAYLKSRKAEERLLLVSPLLMRYHSANDSLATDSSWIRQQMSEMNMKRELKTSEMLDLQIANE